MRAPYLEKTRTNALNVGNGVNDMPRPETSGRLDEKKPHRHHARK